MSYLLFIFWFVVQEKAAFKAILRRMLSQRTISRIPKDDGTGYLLY